MAFAPFGRAPHFAVYLPIRYLRGISSTVDPTAPLQRFGYLALCAGACHGCPLIRGINVGFLVYQAARQAAMV